MTRGAETIPLKIPTLVFSSAVAALALWSIREFNSHNP